MKKVNSILLIDDDEATNNLNKYLFTSMELCDRYEIATNGQEGLDYLASCEDDQLPDLILLDINMPLMNGFEFLEQYNKFPNERKKSITLLMLTTSQNPQDIGKGNEFETLSGYVGKPLMKSKIKEVWETHFPD